MANQSQFWADYHKRRLNSGTVGAAQTQNVGSGATTTAPKDLTATGTHGSHTPGATYIDWIKQQQSKGLLGTQANNLELDAASQMDPSQTVRERLGERKSDFYYGGTKDYAQEQAQKAQHLGAQYGSLFGGYGGELRAMGSGAYDRAGPDQTRQENVYGVYMDLARGPEGPSAAQAQLAFATNQNMANNLAIARSGSGMGESAGATRAALAQNTTQGIQAANASAMLRAQETEAYKQRQLAALGAAGGIASGMTEADLKARGLSDAAALGFSTLGLQSYQAGAGTELSAQQLANDIQKAALTGQMGYESNLLQQYGIQEGVKQGQDAAQMAREGAMWNAAGTAAGTVVAASDRRVKKDLYGLSDETEKKDKVQSDLHKLTNPYEAYMSEQEEQREAQKRAAIGKGIGGTISSLGFALSDADSKKRIAALEAKNDQLAEQNTQLKVEVQKAPVVRTVAQARPDLLAASAAKDDALRAQAVATKQKAATARSMGVDPGAASADLAVADAQRKQLRAQAAQPYFTSEYLRYLAQPKIVTTPGATGDVVSDKRAKELQAELDALKQGSYRAPALVRQSGGYVAPAYVAPALDQPQVTDETPAFKLDRAAGIFRSPSWDADDRAAANVINLDEPDRKASVGRFQDAPQDMVREAPGYAYKYKEGAQARFGEDDRTHYGPMAQDLEKTPMGRSTVVEGPGGTKMVDTPKLTLANTAVASAQQKELDDLKRRIAQLTTQFEKSMRVQ